MRYVSVGFCPCTARRAFPMGWVSASGSEQASRKQQATVSSIVEPVVCYQSVSDLPMVRIHPVLGIGLGIGWGLGSGLGVVQGLGIGWGLGSGLGVVQGLGIGYG